MVLVCDKGCDWVYTFRVYSIRDDLATNHGGTERTETTFKRFVFSVSPWPVTPTPDLGQARNLRLRQQRDTGRRWRFRDAGQVRIDVGKLRVGDESG